jgi:hypothetical protein
MAMYIYILKTDNGFAPCPDDGYCTLTCCKPPIRKNAEIGDYIIGIRSADKKKVASSDWNNIVYFMKVTEILTFERYSIEERFNNRLDNIYSKDESGRWKIKQNQYHPHFPGDPSNSNFLEKDIGGINSLISNNNNFWYFGKKLKPLPIKWLNIIKEEVFHVNPKNNGGFVGWRKISPELEKSFFEEVIVLLEKEPSGKLGEPNDLMNDKNCIKASLKCNPTLNKQQGCK